MIDFDEHETRLCEQIHLQWPWISVEDARAYSRSLEGVPAQIAVARLAIWVLARVIERPL